MILTSPDTWPKELLNFLDTQHAMLLAFAQHNEDTMCEYLKPKAWHIPTASMPSNPYSAQWDQATITVIKLLQSTELRGWHCTRLTECEVDDIKQNGMQLPNLELLRKRILQIHASGLISKHIADRLINENHAEDHSRKGMIWFCFSPPRRLAGQEGIGSFFRYWGGEALYNSHDKDLQMGALLKTIGIPCLIEAEVPISALGQRCSLGMRIIRCYLVNRGFDTEESIEHEDNSQQAIPARNVVRVIHHNEEDFTTLTGCDTWSPPL